MSTDHRPPAAALAAERAAYADAAEAFLALLDAVPGDAWERPGLGVWDVRALVGHASRSPLTLGSYLRTRADEEAADSPGAYYALAAELGARLGDEVAERGRAAGAALGENPRAAFGVAVTASLVELDALEGEDPLIDTIVGGARVSTYLPTRTFELTVHGLDLARALALPFEPPRAALASGLGVAGEAALHLGLGTTVLLALTGRETLPPGCTVVP